MIQIPWRLRIEMAIERVVHGAELERLRALEVVVTPHHFAGHVVESSRDLLSRSLGGREQLRVIDRAHAYADLESEIDVLRNSESARLAQLNRTVAALGKERDLAQRQRDEARSRVDAAAALGREMIERIAQLEGDPFAAVGTAIEQARLAGAVREDEADICARVFTIARRASPGISTPEWLAVEPPAPFKTVSPDGPDVDPPEEINKRTPEPCSDPPCSKGYSCTTHDIPF